MSKTQVGIIGAGPSGLLLSQILHLHGIDSIILERQSMDYVLSRVRAGVLEWGSVQVLRDAGVGERMDREGYPHNGFYLSDIDGEKYYVDLYGLTGKSVMVYGQTEITKDLIEARRKRDAKTVYSVESVTPVDLTCDKPALRYVKDGFKHEIECDYIVGCDGYHGVSRKCIPTNECRSFEKLYPFGWLGVLSETPPVSDELIYARSLDGFALCSMRSESLSRYYIQCSLDCSPEDWSDEAFWEELRKRIGVETAQKLISGPSIEKSIAPLRSFVCETMRYGNMFLAGDAAHIVPPTGAKGLNLAISDIRILSEAFIDYYKNGDPEPLAKYPDKALKRIWKAERFSWWMSHLTHNFPDQPEFDRKLRDAEFDYVVNSEAGLRTIAENYVGLHSEQGDSH